MDRRLYLLVGLGKSAIESRLNRLRRTVGAAALLLAAGSAWAVSPGPSFYNLYDFNAEYALDRLSNAWDPDDRADFRAVGTGLRVTGGSLNIRHLQVREDIKLRVPFGARWTARFRRERDLGLSGKEERSLLEIEHRLAGPWAVGVVGAPAFHKAEASLGFSTAWRRREDRFVRASILWPGFDTNYAYKNTSVTEDHRRAYRTFPREGRVEAVWQSDRLWFGLDGQWARRWELEHEDFAPGAEKYVETGERRALSMDASGRFGEWTGGGEWEYSRHAGSVVYDPARPGEDRSVSEESFRSIFHLEKHLSNAAIRLTAAPAVFRGRQTFAGSPGLNEFFVLRDRIVGVSYLPRFGSGWSGEASYWLDSQSGRIRRGGSEDLRPRTQNRALVALRWKKAPGNCFVVAANVEMDNDEAEKIFSFDGGVVQFQTVLP